MNKPSKAIYPAEFTHRSIGAYGAKCPFCEETITQLEIKQTMMYFVAGLYTPMRTSRFAHISCVKNVIAKILSDPIRVAKFETTLLKVIHNVTRGKGCFICRQKGPRPLLRIQLGLKAHIIVCVECLSQIVNNDNGKIAQKQNITTAIDIREKEKRLAEKRALRAQFEHVIESDKVELSGIRSNIVLKSTYGEFSMLCRSLKMGLPTIAPDMINSWEKYVKDVCIEVVDLLISAIIKRVSKLGDRHGHSSHNTYAQLRNKVDSIFDIHRVHWIYSKTLLDLEFRAKVLCGDKAFNPQILYRAPKEYHALLLANEYKEVRETIVFRQFMNAALEN